MARGGRGCRITLPVKNAGATDGPVGLSALRARMRFVPRGPGVYLMRDGGGAVVYVGKAKNLRRRIGTYFRRGGGGGKAGMTREIADFEVHTTPTEKDALLLEERLISDLLPRHNLAQRGGLVRGWIRIDLGEKMPRLEVVSDDGGVGSFFGPYPVEAARWLVGFLNRLYGLRPCPHPAAGRRERAHCLEPVVNHCCEPCVGGEGLEGYSERAGRAAKWLSQPLWRIEGLVKDSMTRLARGRRFERAAGCRDFLAAVGGPRTGVPPRGIAVGRELAREQVDALAEELGIAGGPRVMECFDVSHLGGRGNVVSMARFVWGVVDPRGQRYFPIGEDGTGDAECIRQAVLRRCWKGRPPDLVVIDGGEGQLSAAKDAMVRGGWRGVAVLAISKERELLHLGGGKVLRLPATSPALHLVQRARDEAHRLANGYTRSRSRQRVRGSSILSGAGIGPKTAERLISSFGSAHRALRAAESELLAVRGVGARTARKVLECAGRMRGSGRRRSGV